MAEHVSGGDGLFAAGGELGPVGGDRLVQVELATVGEDEAAQRSHRLGGRPDVDDRVLLPVALDAGDAGVVVVGSVERGGAAPQVDDELAADRDRDDAPTSPWVSKLLSNAARTASKPGATVPWISAIGPR